MLVIPSALGNSFSPALRPPGKASLALGSEASWKDEYSRLTEEILVRHYSPMTLQTYRGWTQKFQAFTRSKGPELLSSPVVLSRKEIDSVLKHLAPPFDLVVKLLFGKKI